MTNSNKNNQKKGPKMVKTAKTLFPYSGSKYKYEEQLQNVASKLEVTKVDTYIEPFAGSLGSFFHMSKKIEAKRYFINDINPRITNIYIQIKENPEEVAKAYANLEIFFQSLLPKCVKPGLVKKELRHLMEDARDFYLSVRAYINGAPLSAKHAAAMIFVLNHNFNGLYGESKKKSEFNISFNWNSRRIKFIGIVKLIREMHAFFIKKNVEITTMDVFALLKKHNNPDTFIYLDPPYIDNRITYVSNGFNISLQNQMELLHMTNKYKYVMYSNHTHEAFEGFFDEHINFYRTNKISSAKNERKKSEIMAYKINVNTASINNSSFSKVKRLSEKKVA